MPQVHGDPEKLRTFARSLRKYRRALEQSTYGMEGRARELGESWRDREYNKFMEEWQTSARAIDHLLEECDTYVSHVLLKAKMLEDYLRHGKL